MIHVSGRIRQPLWSIMMEAAWHGLCSLRGQEVIMFFKKMKCELLVLGALSMALFGCGSNNQNVANGTACGTGYTYYNGVCSYTGTYTNTGYNSCSTGYVYTTTYGCLPQGSCQAGYGTYNGSCVAGTTSTTTTSPYQGSCQVGYVQTANYGCLPQNAACMNGYGYMMTYQGAWCVKSVYLN